MTLQQLAQAMDASVSTLRRDLDALEADGILDRTHGGALLRQQHYKYVHCPMSMNSSPIPACQPLTPRPWVRQVFA